MKFFLDFFTDMFAVVVILELQIFPAHFFIFWLLEETVQNDFHLKPKYEKMRREYLQFKDNNHSKHICEEIKKKFH